MKTIGVLALQGAFIEHVNGSFLCSFLITLLILQSLLSF